MKPKPPPRRGAVASELSDAGLKRLLTQEEDGNMEQHTPGAWVRGGVMLTPAGASSIMTTGGQDIAYVVEERDVPLILTAPKLLDMLEKLVEAQTQNSSYREGMTLHCRDVIAEAGGKG